MFFRNHSVELVYIPNIFLVRLSCDVEQSITISLYHFSAKEQVLKISAYLDSIYTGVHRTKTTLDFIEFVIRTLQFELTLVGTQSSFKFADTNACISSNLSSASI